MPRGSAPHPTLKLGACDSFGQRDLAEVMACLGLQRPYKLALPLGSWTRARTSLAHGVTSQACEPSPGLPGGLPVPEMAGEVSLEEDAELPSRAGRVPTALGRGTVVVSSSWGAGVAPYTIVGSTRGRGLCRVPGATPARTHLRSGTSRPRRRQSGCPLRCGGRPGRRRGPPRRRGRRRGSGRCGQLWRSRSGCRRHCRPPRGSSGV